MNPCMLVGDNLLTDASFDNGLECWTTGNWGASVGTFTPNAGVGNDGMNSIEVEVTTPNPDNALQVSVSKSGLNLTEGENYVVSFNLMSNSGNEEIVTATIFSDPNIGGATAWGQVFNQPDLAYQGDGMWHNFEFEFTAAATAGDPDFEQLVLLFGFAKNTGTFFIDDVSLVPVATNPCVLVGDNLLTDPSFDSGIDCWVGGNWGMAMATYTPEPTIGNDGMNSIQVDVTTANPDNALQATLSKQVIALTVGQTYELSFHLMSNSGVDEIVTATIFSDPNLGGAADWGQVFNEADLTYPGDGAWHNFTFEFVAGATAGDPDFEKLTVALAFGKTVGTFFVDDMALIPGDPPAVCDFVGDNLISDPTMDVGLPCWSTAFWGTAVAEFANNEEFGSDGANSIEINVTTANPDNVLQANVLKPMLTLVEDQAYELSFNVMSMSGAEESVLATIISDATTGGSTWGQFFNAPDLVYAGDGEWHNFTFQFLGEVSAGMPSFDAAGLLFGFGKNTGTYYLDEVSLMEIDSLPVSTNDFLANELNVSIVPNPVVQNTLSHFIVDMPQTADLNWRLTTITGQTVYQEKINNLDEGRHSLPLSMSNLEKGVYILVGETRVGNFTKKLVVQ